MENIDYVYGLKGSYAQKLYDEQRPKGFWIVSGNSYTLSQSEVGEYGFKIDLDSNDLNQLPDDAPIYAGVFAFSDPENGMEYKATHNLTNDYETKGDLRDYAIDAIKSAYEDSNNKDHYVSTPWENEKIIKDVENKILILASWQSLSTASMDVSADIEDCESQEEWEAYPDLFIQKQ